MIILGIDPGVISTGYGAIKIDERRASLIDFGVIKVEREQELSSRLNAIYQGIAGICAELRPDALAIEEIYFSKNARTALTVGHTRGAVILAAVHHGVDVFAYTPLQIKQTVSGYGRADKSQMQKVIKMILGLQEIPRPDHAADALGAALCHYYISRTTTRFCHKGTKWGEKQ